MVNLVRHACKGVERNPQNGLKHEPAMQNTHAVSVDNQPATPPAPLPPSPCAQHYTPATNDERLPSSAIRRHKMRRGVGKRRATGSPTRVLETLDLAKKMEQSLKHRYTPKKNAPLRQSALTYFRASWDVFCLAGGGGG